MNEGTNVNPAARRGGWKQALAIVVGVLALVVTLLVGTMLLGGGGAPPTAETGLPWQVKADGAGGAEVFGLTLGRTTLADVRTRFGDNLRVGLIAPNGQAPALEGYVETFQAGFVTGKLVLAFEADPAWLEAARGRAPRFEVGEGGRSRRYALRAEDLDQVLSRPLLGLAFVPAARLDETVVTQRFGPPGERFTGADGVLQLLYPDRGIAIALPPAEGDEAKARPVIQYTAPRDFEARLRAPLKAVGAASS